MSFFSGRRAPHVDLHLLQHMRPICSHAHVHMHMSTRSGCHFRPRPSQRQPFSEEAWAAQAALQAPRYLSHLWPTFNTSSLFAGRALSGMHMIGTSAHEGPMAMMALEPELDERYPVSSVRLCIFS